MGALLALSLVVTQFPVGGTAKADTETKASITSSKMQFTYAKKGADVQSSLMFCENTIRLNMMEKEQPKALKV